MFGLSKSETDYILNTIVLPVQTKNGKVYCFGSRARGDHQKFSDLDLLIEGDVGLKKLLPSITEKLENENFPYKVDLVFYEDLAKSYKESVTQDRIEFLSAF